jgi:hypothetical protein
MTKIEMGAWVASFEYEIRPAAARAALEQYVLGHVQPSGQGVSASAVVRSL